MQVCCIQSNPQNNYSENIQFLCTQIKEAKLQGAQIIVLPEMFSFMGGDEQRLTTKSKLHEGAFHDVQCLAKELKVHIVAGSHAEAHTQNKVYNTSVAYDGNGTAVSVYRKLHLFNLKDAQGNKLYCESDVFEQGNLPHTYELVVNDEVWNCATIICYDVRFPEIVRCFEKPIDILFVPAAFVWQTGKDHWEVLLRARAIENQCYVVACNQTGFHTNGEKRNYGNSMIIDPWGNIVARMGEEVGMFMAEISKEKIRESRGRLPALADRKIWL